jgi:hypothetical protein
MTPPTLDLWPDDLSVASEPIVAAILRQQGRALAEKTKGYLEGEVYSRPERGKEAYAFLHDFRIHAPTFNDYRYSLLDVRHDFDEFPVSIRFKPTGEEYTACSEDEFVDRLKRLFSHPKTTQMIRTLLAQVEAQSEAGDE